MTIIEGEAVRQMLEDAGVKVERYGLLGLVSTDSLMQESPCFRVRVNPSLPPNVIELRGATTVRIVLDEVPDRAVPTLKPEPPEAA